MSSTKLFETRLMKEGSELATKCSQLKMQSAGNEIVTTCHGLKMVAPDRRMRLTQFVFGKPIVTSQNAKRPGIIRALQDWPHIEFTDDRQGNQFRVILKREQLPDGGVSGGVNVGVNYLHAYIQAHPGQLASEMTTANKVPQRVIERWLKQLKVDGKVEFKGAPKTGGYHCI